MLKRQLQALLDRSRFLRPYRFRVVAVKKGKCTLELPHRPVLDRPGGIINGPALMAAADCAMWLAIKAHLGVEQDALTSELSTAFLAPAKGEHVYCTAEILKMGRRRALGPGKALSQGSAQRARRDGPLWRRHCREMGRRRARLHLARYRLRGNRCGRLLDCDHHCRK